MQNLFTPKNIRSLCVFFFFFPFFLFFMKGSPGSDSYASFMTARSIVEHETIALSVKQEPDPNLPHRGSAITSTVHVGDKNYSKYGIGWAAFMIPFYLVGKIVSLLFQQINSELITLFSVCTIGPFLTALFLAFLYRFCLVLKFSENIALATTMISAFTTSIPFYGLSPYVETLDALLILMIVYQIYLFCLEKGKRRLIYVGLITAYLITTKVYNCIIVLPIIIWIVWFLLFIKRERIQESVKAVSLLLIPISLSLIFLFLINYLRFGSFFSTGYGGVQGIIPMYQGLYGFLFSYGKSIFIYSPILILVAITIGYVIKQNKPLAFGVVLIFLTYICFLSIFPNWLAGPWGTRYLFPTISVMMILVPFGLQKLGNQTTKTKKAFLIVIISFGFFVNLPTFFIDVYKWEVIGRNTGAFNRYEMTYMPSLSQAIGSWYLFKSSIKKAITEESDWLDGQNTGVTFNENCPVGNVVNNQICLDKFDEPDIWLLRIMRGSVIKSNGTVAMLPGGRRLKILSVIASLFLLASILASCRWYVKSLFNSTRQ